MARSALRTAVLLPLLLAASPLAARPSRELLASNKLAHVYGITLAPGSRARVGASTGHGLVWVAITRGIVGVSEHGVEVRAGTVDRLDGKVGLTLQAPAGAAARFVVVDVLDAFQTLTLSAFSGMPAAGKRDRVDGSDALEPGQALEEASDQNDTLIIAIGNLRLRDTWNLADDEAEPWRSSKPLLIKLTPGGVRWTRPGVHHFKNTADTPARFVMVGW